MPDEINTEHESLEIREIVLQLDASMKTGQVVAAINTILEIKNQEHHAVIEQSRLIESLPNNNYVFIV